MSGDDSELVEEEAAPVSCIKTSVASCSEFSFSKRLISCLSWASASCRFTSALACSKSSDCCQLWMPERAMQARSVIAFPSSPLASLMSPHFSPCISFFTMMPSLEPICSAISSIFFKCLARLLPMGRSSLPPMLRFFKASSGSSWLLPPSEANVKNLGLSRRKK